MTENLQNIRDAVAALHRCKAEHLHTAHVHEMMDGQTVWKATWKFSRSKAILKQTGLLHGHGRDDEGETHYMAVLNIPPIVSPREAVQAAIVSGKQK